MISLSGGHVAQELGNVMEEEFRSLVEGIGYKVIRIRNPHPGIDLIADFSGTPRLPEPANECALLRPVFSPQGITAFSIKRGEFGKKDITELLGDVEEARKSTEEPLKSIVGGVIVTNHTKTEGDIDGLLEQGVFCWDARRLIFYATKAHIVSEETATGNVSEFLLPESLKGSYLIKPREILSGNTLLVNVTVFIDDHHAFLCSDHITDILKHIYNNSLAPMATTTRLIVSTTVTMHVLGLANLHLAERSYIDYGSAQSEHPKVTFSASPSLRIFQYGAALWTPILHM